MVLPTITLDDVRRLVPSATAIEDVGRGGQKRVFGCVLDGRRYVLKFMLAAEEPTAPDASRDDAGEVEARARREVDTMRDCRVPTIVRLGPIGLTQVDLNGQKVLYFSEERIDGKDLRRLLTDSGPLGIDACVRLGKDITSAVADLWRLARVHRDIKPGNIMHREADDTFVLLDIGLAFDLADESITRPGVVVGTPIYLSPEQMDFAKRRQMDFRSDLFSLGIVMYEMATGRHPFAPAGVSTHEALGNILTAVPPPPQTLRREIPDRLGDVILRLLAKRPHLRFRSCDQLTEALDHVRSAEE